MCKNLAQHFKKHNQWYSFGLLLIMALMVVYLFLKVDALETDIDRQINEPNIDHQFTIEQYKKKSDTATIQTEVIVSPDALPGQEMPGTVPPTGAVEPNGVVVPGGAPSPDTLGPRGRMLPPDMVNP